MDVTKAAPSTDVTARVGVGATTGSAQSGAAGPGAAQNASPVVAPGERVDIQPLDVTAALQILIAEVRAELPPVSDSAEIPVPPQALMPVEGATSNAGTGSLPVVQPDIAPTLAPEVPTLVPLPALFPVPPTLGVNPADQPPMPPGSRLPMPSPLSPGAGPAQAAPVLMRLFLQAVPDVSDPVTWMTPTTWTMVPQLEAALQSALDRAVTAVEQWRDVSQVVVDAARETRTLVMSQFGDGPPNLFWLRPELMWMTPQWERYRRRRRMARRALTDPDSWLRRQDESMGEEEIREEKDKP